MKKMRYEWIKGGVTAPAGFSAAGIQAGIKTGGKGKKDMALIVADCPSVAAGVFTVNSVKAAPVILCRQHLKKSRLARAIIVNSGNANACTGRQGCSDAESMAATTGKALNINHAQVLVCSTGTIGLPLPMQKIESGIHCAVKNLSRNGGNEAARAIMTTDTMPKQVAVRLRSGGKKITIGAMAKGAGMIAPNMATLLVFITTDASIEKSALQEALSSAVAMSFNRILVDGDQSTNDTVLCLANGLAGNKPMTKTRPDWATFKSALTAVCLKLAYKIVKDGEGVTKVVKVVVKGGKNQAEAEKTARSIARSPLVKTSWFGADPNWGRVICAIGYSGADVVPDKISIHYNAQAAVINGKSAGLSPDKLHKIISGKEFTIEVNLHQGKASYAMLTCDCSLEYVRINADYMT
jgi:glutamate N-acetyltransferase/amino-acid N-acetyltransferase